VLSRPEAVLVGAVGPAARSTGISDDARTSQAGWLTYDGFEPAIGERASGDVRARFDQRKLELRQTFALLGGFLSSPITADACASGDHAVAHAVTRIESPRGATICALEGDGARLDRLHLHTGSYANWPVLARIVSGNLLPDFPLINKSFELCYACADR
jgi:Ni,Fe-hydrogenase III large subunit